MTARDPNRRYNLTNKGPDRGDKVRYYWTRETNNTFSLIRVIFRMKTKISEWNYEVDGLSKEEYFKRKIAEPNRKDTFYVSID